MNLTTPTQVILIVIIFFILSPLTAFLFLTLFITSPAELYPSISFLFVVHDPSLLPLLLVLCFELGQYPLGFVEDPRSRCAASIAFWTFNKAVNRTSESASSAWFEAKKGTSTHFMQK